MSDELLDGFLNDYYAECEEHISGARAALLALESAAGRPATQRKIVDELFRFFHSLKGISAMVEFRPAEQLAHGLEEYLRAVRAGELSVTQDGLSLVIEGTQLLEQLVKAHRSHRDAPSIDAIIARIDATIPHAGRKPDGAPALHDDPPGDAVAGQDARRTVWKCTFAPTRELLNRGVSVDTIRRRLAAVGTIIDAVPVVTADAAILFTFTVEAAGGLADALQGDPITVEQVDAQSATDSAPLAPPATDYPTETSGSIAPSHVVRVDLTRLDELMRQVGDLVISRARLLEALSKVERYVPATEWRDAQENALAIDRQLRLLREGLMRIRLVPIGEIFRRMPFVVRDLARETGRNVKLLLHGQSTEIDKYLIERMMDPVLHLVRNAVSHGIEPPDERTRCGKPSEGTITLRAAAAGDVVTIEVADDGRGVDAAEVAARARRAGLPVPSGPLDSNAVLALLCSPGFSTKDETDRASGRGVGMAVVKETVERLSGSLAIESDSGRGTRFTMRLPLTLAIADALIGRVAGESFAVPQSTVREAIEVLSSDVRQIEGNEIVPYRQASLPIVRLARLFGIRTELLPRFHVFVIGTGASAIGLAVDRIVGQREIVVRAIADPLVRVEGVSGATDLGDGKVVLILDPIALGRAVRQRGARAAPGLGDWGRVSA